QTLDNDVDRVPAESGERTRRVGRHDRLDAGRELGRFLTIEHRVEPYSPFWEGRMELEEGVGLTSVVAGGDHATLQTLRVLGIENNHYVAPIHRLRNQDRERDTLAGLCRTGNARSAFKVHKRSIQGALSRFDAV